MNIECGLYPDLPASVYFAADGLNSSLLKILAKAPAKYAHALQAGTPDSPALRFGRLTHALTLEPDTVDAAYHVVDVSTRTTKAYKDASAKLPGKEVVLAKEFEQAQAIANAVSASPQVRAHDRYGDLLAASMHRELSGFWQEGRHIGKFRADLLSHDCVVLADLKTCASASPDAFPADAWRYGYHVSAAWYCRGIEILTGVYPETVLWIAVEKEPPYVVQVYEATTALLSEGWEVCLSALDNLSMSQQRNQWQGYASHALPLDVPAWARPAPVTATEELMA